MPEVLASQCLRAAGKSERTVRLFLTFVATVDLMCDARKLWRNGVALLDARPELFDPNTVSQMSPDTLLECLSEEDHKVSGRFPVNNAKAWRYVAHMLAYVHGPVRKVVDDGVGNAKELLAELRSATHSGYYFRQLRGPKIGPMWVRIMAAPGNADIEQIKIIPVAVDTRVRRVTEQLGVTGTQGLPPHRASKCIQSAWFRAVEVASFGGPPGIEGTCAALDPALWSYAEEA